MPDLLPLSEKDFQVNVLEAAAWSGWLAYHPERGQLNGRWLTPGSNGFPDLVLAHPQRGVMFVELKADTGRLSDAQVEWLQTLTDGGAEAHVWRPRDWDRILARLRG